LTMYSREQPPSASIGCFRALVENSSDAIVLMNAETRITYASPSTSKVLGYPPEELVGRNGLDLVHPQDRDHSGRSLTEVLVEPRSPNRIQARVRQKDGQWIWVESTAHNLLDKPEIGAIMVNYRGIEGHKAAEEERQRYAEELARSNAELQAFAQSVAHDLREPLRTIGVFTEILVQKMQLDQDGKEIAQLVVGGVTRMNTLLDDLLTSAKYGGCALRQPVKLEHAVELAIENLTEALRSSGAIVKVEPLPTVQGNERDLVRLFQNLIGNAVKYRSEAPTVIRITAERSGRDWVIKIHDNGVGIEKEHHQTVFGLFMRLHTQEIPGTGIGLAICKKIVEGMGGKIWVESEPGAGSTFCFTVA
jgi:PAS domain S-box-containing protein